MHTETIEQKTVTWVFYTSSKMFGRLQCIAQSSTQDCLYLIFFYSDSFFSLERTQIRKHTGSDQIFVFICRNTMLIARMQIKHLIQIQKTTVLNMLINVFFGSYICQISLLIIDLFLGDLCKCDTGINIYITNNCC